MSVAYGIRFYGKRWMAHSDYPQQGAEVAYYRGWRPLKWTSDMQEAEKFGSAAAARLFLENLPCRAHAEVAAIPGRSGPKVPPPRAATIIQFRKVA